MSKYTTGELAKRCGVTVRTVQYYDTRGILIPSALSEGGRRLYSEDDLKRMKIICFLRELGLPIDAIGQLLSEADPGSVISLLLDQQEAALRQEIGDQEARLRKLTELKAGLKGVREFSFDSIGDVAYIMSNREALRKLRVTMTLTAIPLSVLQWSSVYLRVRKGLRWPLPVWGAAAAAYTAWLSRWYFRKMAYICPQCHAIFQPGVREGLWAKHTPAARKLTCPHCGRLGFCVEIAAEPEVTGNA